MSRRHNEATDRLVAALADRHERGWDLEPEEEEALAQNGSALTDDVRSIGTRAATSPRRGGGVGKHVRADEPGAPPWLRMPDGLAHARVTAIRPAILALLALVVGLVAVLGVRLARAQELGDPVAPGGEASAPGDAATPGLDGAQPPGRSTDNPASGSPAPAPSPSPTEVVVHVVGQVRRPGVIDLPAGSRVVDAIDGAGGARSGADLTAVNLARPVVDGEQILVPKPGQRIANPPVPVTPGAGGSGGSPTAADSPKVNLNAADATALDALPGVGPVLAGRILDWRSEHGRFTSVDELGEVSGIGEKLLAQIRPLVTL